MRSKGAWLWPYVLCSACFPALLGALTLEEAVQDSWSSSKQIQAQQSLVEISSGDRFRRFVFSEPQISYNNTDDNTDAAWGLTLGLAFPGKTLAAMGLDEAAWEAQKAELEARRFDLAKAMAQAFMDCASAQATLKLQQENVADLEVLARSIHLQYEAGHSTQAEKIGTDLQLNQARSDLRASQDALDLAWEKLRTLLGLQQTEPKDVTLPDDLDASILEALGSRTSDQARNQAAQRVASANASFAWWNQLPDLNLNLSRNHYLYSPGSPAGTDWTTSYGVSLNLPILFPLREVVEARRSASQAERDLDDAHLQLLAADADHLEASKEYRRSKARLAELRQRDLALAEALKDSAYSAYKQGKLGFADLMLARKTYSDLKAQDIQLRNSIINAHLRCLKDCGEDAAIQTGSLP
jgi:cobalt-zinc-cadmium efflux system outer membrane protein